MKGIFAAFERVLGPAGAAKCLHLLTPILPLVGQGSCRCIWALGRQDGAERASLLALHGDNKRAGLAPGWGHPRRQPPKRCWTTTTNASTRRDWTSGLCVAARGTARRGRIQCGCPEGRLTSAVVLDSWGRRFQDDVFGVAGSLLGPFVRGPCSLPNTASSTCGISL